MSAITLVNKWNQEWTLNSNNYSITNNNSTLIMTLLPSINNVWQSGLVFSGLKQWSHTTLVLYYQLVLGWTKNWWMSVDRLSRRVTSHPGPLSLLPLCRVGKIMIKNIKIRCFGLNGIFLFKSYIFGKLLIILILCLPKNHNLHWPTGQPCLCVMVKWVPYQLSDWVIINGDGGCGIM